MSRLLGYARLSASQPNPDRQVAELMAAGCYEVWIDCTPQSRDRRPQLDVLLEAAGPGDTLVVWRLDRFGQSLRQLIAVVVGLDERGVGFRSLHEDIDTTAPGGSVVHLFTALKQFERELIRDRTLAGLAAAKTQGRVPGRPSKLSDEQRQQARDMYDAQGLTPKQIGQALGVSRTTILRTLNQTRPGRDRSTSATS